MLAVAGDFLPDGIELRLERLCLLLERGDGAHAAVDGIADARVGLVHQAAGGVGALILWHLHQHLGHIAGAEDFVHAREFLGLVRGEVGRERAFLRAPPSEQLARSTRRGTTPTTTMPLAAAAAQHLCSIRTRISRANSQLVLATIRLIAVRGTPQ